MNNTESLIYTILDAIIEECSYSFAPITRDEIIGRNGNELVRMARCIFVTELKVLGYSNVVIYSFLNRTQQSLDEMTYRAHEFRKNSWIYRKTEAKCMTRCEEIQNQNA